MARRTKRGKRLRNRTNQLLRSQQHQQQQQQQQQQQTNTHTHIQTNKNRYLYHGTEAASTNDFDLFKIRPISRQQWRLCCAWCSLNFIIYLAKLVMSRTNYEGLDQIQAAAATTTTNNNNHNNTKQQQEQQTTTTNKQQTTNSVQASMAQQAGRLVACAVIWRMWLWEVLYQSTIQIQFLNETHSICVCETNDKKN